MEDTRFDDIAKALGALKTRRLTLGAVLGGALSALGLAEAQAAKSGKCKPQPNQCQTCKKGKCRRTNNGKKCKKGKLLSKANGTACSIPGATSATCLNGACIAAVSPPVPPPGPSQICTPNTQTGCTGGQVCNAAGTACVNCISDDPCGTEFDCVNGRCVPATPRD